MKRALILLAVSVAAVWAQGISPSSTIDGLTVSVHQYIPTGGPTLRACVVVRMQTVRADIENFAVSLEYRTREGSFERTPMSTVQNMATAPTPFNLFTLANFVLPEGAWATGARVKEIPYEKVFPVTTAP